MKKQTNGPHLCPRATMNFKQGGGQETEETREKVSRKMATIRKIMGIVKMGARNLHSIDILL